jgi:hypothetical protein
VDFSDTAGSVSRSSAHQLITLRIHNVKDDWKILTNWCASETVIVNYAGYSPGNNCTGYSGCVSSWYGEYCTQWQCPNAYYDASGTYRAFNITQYQTCINNNTPVGTLQATQGWTINGSIEVDGACLN